MSDDWLEYTLQTHSHTTITHSSAEDKLSGETVAIKMVTRVFDKLQLAKRALREITLLRHFSTRGHENVTGLIDLDAVHPDFTEMYVLLNSTPGACLTMKQLYLHGGNVLFKIDIKIFLMLFIRVYSPWKVCGLG